MAVTTTIYRRPPPPEHLEFSAHLTAADCDQAIRETYIGQAHIAGTGPAGTTCRECRFWHKWKISRDILGVELSRSPTPPVSTANAIASIRANPRRLIAIARSSAKQSE